MESKVLNDQVEVTSDCHATMVITKVIVCVTASDCISLQKENKFGALNSQLEAGMKNQKTFIMVGIWLCYELNNMEFT